MRNGPKFQKTIVTRFLRDIQNILAKFYSLNAIVLNNKVKYRVISINLNMCSN